MKLNIVGASHFVNRMFEACGSFQWAREFLKNSLEANATRVEFGIEWQAVEQLGVYRRTIIDDGCGMDSDELLQFFSTLGEGAKTIGGVHDNFGVGAKIAGLPWNPDGLVVISYKDGSPSMIWIALDRESGDFEVLEFDDVEGGGKTYVVDPSQIAWEEGDEIDWGSLRPDWVDTHGTIIVLLGDKANADTVLGNPDANEQDMKGLSAFLNSRFWDLTDQHVTVSELRNAKKSKWPQGPKDKDDTRRANNRRIRGAHHYLTVVSAKSGELGATDGVQLDNNRVRAEWFLWDGDRPEIHMYAKKGGYIAVRYGDELFHLTSSKVQFRHFGVIEPAVQQKLTIILEPQRYMADKGPWGIHPDQSRNRLIFTGNGEKGGELPMVDWGAEFAEKLPSSILDAIHEARNETTTSLDDDAYRQRLQDKFGDRWTMKVLVAGKKNDRGTNPATVSDEDVEVLDDPLPQKRRSFHKRKKTAKVIRRKATPGGNGEGVERDAPVDVPRIRFASGDAFQRDWHLAMWSPQDPDGPHVIINLDSPILLEAEKYHQDRYPLVHAEEVASTVRQVFGEIAACKVAHSQKLTMKIPEQELNTEYRNEAALTLALMGLLAEESLIAQRLVRFGRKKTVE